MITFGQFAEQLALSAERTPQTLRSLVLEVTMEARDAAHSLIGQERSEWPPLAESTLSRKVRRAQVGRVSSTDPLLATGQMRDSYEGTVVGLTGVVGSADPRALWHEFGAHSAVATVPPRPVLSIAMVEAMEVVPELVELALAEIFEGPR